MTARKIVVIGAGMGGLAAAVRLARGGCAVQVLDARAAAGGLAAGLELEGFKFDAGPYILLDRPGLEWAFGSLGMELEAQLSLKRIEDVYEARSGGSAAVHFFDSLERTVATLDETWPGSGRRYRRFIESTAAAYRRLEPIQRVSSPGIGHLLQTGAWRDVPFLLRPLDSVLASARLPPPVLEALAIWTHIAGQNPAHAPSPLAFVPSLIHGRGAWYPAGGIAAVPRALNAAAVAAGVEFHLGARVRSIRCEGGRAIGVEADSGKFFGADAVLANAGGVGTYLELAPSAVPPRARRRLARLPLQSPGICVYLAVKGKIPPPYLRFHLPGGGELCRLLIAPSAVAPEEERNGWWPARLIAPMRHAEAEEGGPEKQREYLQRILGESWWKEYAPEHRVLAARIPAEWGSEFHLHRDSMNPVMTASFMRAGRLAHRSPFARGLYLAGSSTHPGQWVSFCAISGILAAGLALEDLR